MSTYWWRCYWRLSLLIIYLTCTFVTILCTTVSAQVVVPDNVAQCWFPCQETPNSNIPVPGTNCRQFYICRGGRPSNTVSCPDDLVFDVTISDCNDPDLVTCVDPTCEPTLSPSGQPSPTPTNPPSETPTGKIVKCTCLLDVVFIKIINTTNTT